MCVCVCVCVCAVRVRVMEVLCIHCGYFTDMFGWHFLIKVYVFEGMTKNVTSLGFYKDGRFMYSGGEDCMARIWDLR